MCLCGSCYSCIAVREIARVADEEDEEFWKHYKASQSFVVGESKELKSEPFHKDSLEKPIFGEIVKDYLTNHKNQYLTKMFPPIFSESTLIESAQGELFIQGPGVILSEIEENEECDWSIPTPENVKSMDRETLLDECKKQWHFVEEKK